MNFADVFLPRLGAVLGLICLFAFTSVPALAAERAHQHGLAELDVAIEPGLITMGLEAPLDSLLGFERAPRSDAEKAQVKALVARLQAADGLFLIDPAAGCTLASVELSSAPLGLGKAAAPTAGEHGDLDASFSFQCKAAQAAAWIELAPARLPRLRKMAVQIASPAGQFKREWTPGRSRIPLVR